ncbi:YHS domain-containing (seleno)protein [Persicobacter diffluens]|uniref:YHS domain-containing protein n=1 Tax=Persicobacter diffluens TaxID=981 RepID=A0AAN4W288_9BACT|nr:hypothetical protein PEDI_40960 [Persicobacter diffluens]
MKLKALLTFSLVLYSIFAVSQESSKIRQNQFNIEEGLALKGFDPVSYFGKRPAKGKSSYKLRYQGITYYFKNQENLQRFKRNPKKYEPAYGGWCAYAMGANGEKVEVNPETFKIINDRLYLFYNKFFNNTLDSWNKNEDQLMRQANQHWKNHLSP